LFQPSSSVDSFATSTGLLHNNETEETSTIFGYETYGQSTEESTTEFPLTTEELTTELPVTTQQLTKTVSIVPGRITETKIYLSVPTDQSVMVVNIGERGLKKGSNLLFLSSYSTFVNFLWPVRSLALFEMED